MNNREDSHAVYRMLFERGTLSEGELELYCFVSLPMSHRPMGRARRLIQLVLALRKALLWCERHHFAGKKFIIREFSTWSLIINLSIAYKYREYVGYKINHNLAGVASRRLIKVLGKFLNFYYLSGEAAFSYAPACVEIIDVSKAYTQVKVRSFDTSHRHALVVFPKRRDQYPQIDVNELMGRLVQQGWTVTGIGQMGERPLCHEEYVHLLENCSDLILSYHQGQSICRHSGVIWDAILYGVPKIYVPDTPSYRNQVGDNISSRVSFYFTLSDLIESLRVES